ncbi:hypothetical protein [Streptomyces sp. CC219B]|uniref:hypothetical protein n=1 Tax=Streptomyces sp. CC219B TaxID=3044574 RepID=UPI0024A8C103|nr:hypothetical protein [Streptomyces sp. CC219B]
MTLVSLALAAGCVFVLTDWLPADLARYKEYRAAEHCPTGSTPDAWWEDCLREIELSVVDTVVEDRARNSEYRATVESDRVRGDVHIGDPGPLLDTLRAGDTVVGTAWRGDIVALTKDGVRQKSINEPRDEPQMIAAAGAGLGLLALLGLTFGTARLASPRNLGPLTWSGSGKKLFFTNLAATFGVGLPAVWIGIPWQFVTPTIVVVWLGVGFLLLAVPRSEK